MKFCTYVTIKLLLFITNVSLSILFLSITLGSFTFIQVHSQGEGINWGDICLNPFVDKLITESCSSLTTNGGYQLTQQGERALACIAGGGALLLADPTGQAFNYAQSLKSTLGCGGNGGGSSDRDHSRNNPLAQFGDLLVPQQGSSGSNQNPLKDLADKFLTPQQGSSGSNQNPLKDLADKFLIPQQGSSGSNQNPLGNLMGDLFGNK